MAGFRSLRRPIHFALLVGLLAFSTAEAQTKASRPKRSQPRDDSALLDRLSPPAAAPATARSVPTPQPTAPARDPLRRYPPAEVLRAAAAVQEAGYRTIDKDFRTDSPEAALRQRSLIPPLERDGSTAPLRLIEISTTVEADGSGALVLPCPRDVGDQLHVAAQVSVVRVQDGVERPTPHRWSIVYSDSKPSGYINPFVYVDLNEEDATGRLEVRVLHWIVLPEYPRGREPQELAQQAAKPILEAIDRAAAIAYDVEIQFPEAPDQPERGDCSVKAYVARNTQPKLADRRIEVVEGYRFRLPPVDRATGGCHFQNLVISPQGLFWFDATSRGDYFVGPQVGFIATSVGGEFSLPALNDEPGKFHHGSNLGFYSGFKSYGQSRLSTATFGERAEALAELEKRRPEIVARYAEVLWRERVRVYGAGK